LIFAPARPFPTRAAEGRRKTASGCVLGAVGKMRGRRPEDPPGLKSEGFPRDRPRAGGPASPAYPHHA